MPLWSARRTIALLLIATLIPAQGLAWPMPTPAWRPATGPSDAITLRVFLNALNATGQQVMIGANRPQLYLVFNVDVPVPAVNAPLFTAEDLKWFDEFMNEIANQPPAATTAANAEPKESILDEIDALDAQVRSLPLAKQLASIPDRLNFAGDPNDGQSMSAAMTDALETAGIDATRYGRTTFDRGTSTATYQGERFDGQIIMTGHVVNGQLVLTKEFKPLTRSGRFGETVTIRGTGPSPTPVTQTSGEPVNTVTTTPGTTLVFTPSAAAATTQLRIVTGAGGPGDAVYNGQPFHLETSLPAAGAPPSLTATLTTPGGDQQTVNLIRTVTRDGMTIYSSPQISFHGGRLAQGTLQELDVSNGQVVTVTAPGMQTGVTVYTDDIQLGIARVTEALNATSDELVRQKSYVNAQLSSAAAGSDPALKANLTQWNDDIDSKLTFISQTRQAMAGTDQPGLQLMLGQRRFEWLTGSWDSFDPRIWYGNTVIEEQFKEHKGELFTDVMRGFTMGLYQQVARMSLVAQFKTVFTGVNEFGQKLTYEELLAENRGLAFDLAMFWVPNKITDSLVNGGFSGELVISSGTPGGRVLVPARTMTGGGPSAPAGGRPPVTAATTPPVGPVVVAGNKPLTGAPDPVNTPDAVPAGKPPASTSRPPTAFNEDPVIPQVDRGIDGKPGAPVTRISDAEIASNAADDLAELTVIYNKNLTAARAAGVPDSRIKQIVGDGEISSAVAEQLYREATLREGKILVSRNEFSALSGLNVRSQKGGLSDADYEFLRTRLAQDPTYVDNLPNRGGMPQETGVGDGFTPALTAAQRDALLQNPRVAQMVADAKSAAAANPTVIMPGGAQPSAGTPTVRDLNVTTLDPNKTTINPNQTVIVDPNKTALMPSPGAQPGVAGVADNTGTVIVPRGATPSSGTPTVRDPNVTTLDPNKTTINPNQTVIVDPNKTALMPSPGAQPGVAGVADNTGTVIVPRGATAPTVRLGPEATAPTVRLGPEATAPTVRLGPDATAPTVRMNPEATTRMANELSETLPKARQSGLTPKQVANDVRAAMTRLGVGPQQLVTSLRQRLLPRPVSFSDLGNTTASTTPPGLGVSIAALGVSSGEAFRVTAVNNGTTPVQLSGEGIVVEPVTGKAPANFATAKQPPATQTVEAFCLERVRPVATPGTQYRVAPPAAQQQHRKLVDVLHAAQRVQSAGLLRPDSEAKSYFNFIRQWSIWTRQENFDEKKFTDEFLNQTKKNVESQNVKWTDAMQNTVRKAAPGRWNDINSILDEANKPKIQAAAAHPASVLARSLRPARTPAYRRRHSSSELINPYSGDC